MPSPWRLGSEIDHRHDQIDLEILRLLDEGKLRQIDIAKQVGCSQYRVSRMKRAAAE